MTNEEIEELKGLAASMGLYDDKNPCKRAKILGKTIKILEQGPCEDAISRQAVLDLVTTIETDDCSGDEIMEVVNIDDIKELPPVTPQPKVGRWTPVSEGLPKNTFVRCHVTVEEDDMYGEPQRVLYPDFVGYDGETWNNADGMPIPFEVIAWMPSPEPYVEQKSEG